MSDIFREVDEDVRRDRFEQIWKQYGSLIVAAAMIMVAAVAGSARRFRGWRNCAPPCCSAQASRRGT
jgi:hypothetical protein